MSATGFSLRHGSAVVFTALVLAAIGLAVGSRLPSGVYPELSFPREQVVVTAAGASASSLQVGVTRPLEAALAAVPGVEHIRSRTIRGAVELSLFFAPSTEMTQAHQLVLAATAEARATLSAGLDISVERVLPSGFPILSYNIEGPYPPEQLYELAEYTLRPALAGLPGIGRVSVQSSDVPETQVLLDATRLAAAHLTVPQVADRVRAANVVRAVARFTETHELALGVVTNELLRPEDVGRLVVGGTTDAPLRVSDLGTVRESIVPPTTVIRVDGKPGVILNLARRLGGDIVARDQAARARLEALRPSLPPGITFVTTYEQADFVREAVAGLREALLFGALFAVLVLALFLRSFWATALAALSLPLTLAAALLILWALDQTLNLMTLGGLAVAVGLVIDDAVVVIEAIHAKLQQGLSPSDAAQRGPEELLWPVVGTTVTTLVVFLPLGLLSGVAGQFFSALSLALVAAVLLSLPVSLMVLPPLAARLLSPLAKRPRTPGLGARYRRALDWTLARRPLVFAAAGLCVAVAAGLFTFLPTDFLPETDEGAYVIDYFAPVGASLAEADQLAQRVEEVVRATPEVAAFSRRLGAELGPPTATLASNGDVAVRLKTKRSRDIEAIMADQRRRLAAVAPGLRVEFIQVLSDMLGDLQGSPEPLELKILGPDVTVLHGLAREASLRLKDIPGLVDVFDGDDGCVPQEEIQVDPLRADRQGLSATQIADQLEGDFLGQVATQLHRPDHLENVRLRLAGPREPGPQSLRAAQVATASGALAPLEAVADLGRSCPPAVLWRDNQRNFVHLTARLSGTSLGAAANALRQRLADWRLPVGYTWELGGLVEQQRQSQRSVLFVALLALLLVTGVLLFQLRSARRTLAVLLAAPLALTGGLLALTLTGIPLNLAALMGGILLIGLVVKNGILLLDYALAAESRGVAPHDALREAAQARLRPILMTTLATMAALVPLVIGLSSGSALHRPLAVVVLGGLAFSTAATLFLIPALVDRRGA